MIYYFYDILMYNPYFFVYKFTFIIDDLLFSYILCDVMAFFGYKCSSPNETTQIL